MRHMAWQMILAPFGVLFIILLSWWMGAFKTGGRLDPVVAEERFFRDFPEHSARRTIVSLGGEAALIDLGNSALGLVTTVGDRLATRLWRKGDIGAVESDENTLIVTPASPMDAAVRFELAEAEATSHWHNILKSLAGDGS